MINEIDDGIDYLYVILKQRWPMKYKDPNLQYY